MASIFRTEGLNLNMYSPPWQGSLWLRNYTDYVEGYSHELASFGGFNQASISLGNQPIGTLEDWTENGLGREMKVTSGDNQIVFEGFINQMDFEVAGFSFSLGPFLDIANRIALTYSYVDTSTGTAITGLRATSPWYTDDISIGKYGVQSKMLSSGGIDLDAVDGLIALALDRLAQPQRTEDLNLSGSGETFSIKLTIAGWWNMFEKYVYNNTADPTAINVSDKLIAIVAAEPNLLFKSSGIQKNDLQVSSWENDNAEAWGLIKANVNLGDTGFNRYTFGVYENRLVRYGPVENKVTYYRPVGEKLQTLLDESDNRVPPWLVRPGYWVRVRDLTPARKTVNDFNDIGYVFIESLSYSAPDNLSLNGGHNYRLTQRLAQLGLSGIGI